MAKGQMRVPKEKKKPKADKDKPKQLSAYKLAQQGHRRPPPLRHSAGQEGVSSFQRLPVPRRRAGDRRTVGRLGHFQAGEQLNIARRTAELRQGHAVRSCGP